MLDYIISLDVSLIEWIHMNLHADWANTFVPYLRNKYTWIPLYIFLIAFVLINYKWKGALWMLCILVVVGLADLTSTRLLKYNVKRLRPCHNEQVVKKLDMHVGCGGLYGFVSSHATNHFGIAFFIFYTLGNIYKRIKWPILLWAGAIAFAQVYVGVHYPLDVLCGALLGWAIGGLLAWYFNRRWQLPYLEQEHSKTTIQQHGTT